MSNQTHPLTVAIIGGGPAGLMAAEVLSQSNANIRIDLYDAMPSLGRKFLMAGKGGMNISHAEPLEQLLPRYQHRKSVLAPLITAFGPEQIRDWMHTLGIESFVGSSGKIFPKDLKAAPLLRAWLHRLRAAGVRCHVRHQWLGWHEQQLLFHTPDGEKNIHADATILALGGASWPQLGSSGTWLPLLNERSVTTAPFQPANCGFNVNWSAHFQARFAGQPLKTVSLTWTDSTGASNSRYGELLISANGIEGHLIYQCAAALRESINKQGPITVHLDLLPQQSEAQLQSKLAKARGKNSLANHLRKQLGIDGLKAALLRECLSKEEFNDTTLLAKNIKALPLTLISPRPIEEAISSAGGVLFEALDENLMAKALPGVFFAGEMLDWEAPTGGYLLTACFATGHAAATGTLVWLAKQNKLIG